VNRIKNEIKSKLGGFNESNPEHREAFEEAIKKALIEVIAHEKGHVLDWDPEQHKFPGGEGAAEREVHMIMPRVSGLKGFCKKAQWEEESNSDAADWWKPEEERNRYTDEDWKQEEERDKGHHGKPRELDSPAIPIDPKQFKFQVGDKVQHEEIPGSVGTILNPFWVGQMYDDIDKTDPEYTTPWYEIQWEIMPDTKLYKGREPEGVLEKEITAPSSDELEKWFKASGLKHFTKTARDPGLPSHDKLWTAFMNVYWPKMRAQELKRIRAEGFVKDEDIDWVVIMADIWEDYTNKIIDKLFAKGLTEEQVEAFLQPLDDKFSENMENE
jgi:hypothetical protein